MVRDRKRKSKEICPRKDLLQTGDGRECLPQKLLEAFDRDSISVNFFFLYHEVCTCEAGHSTTSTLPPACQNFWSRTSLVFFSIKETNDLGGLWGKNPFQIPSQKKSIHPLVQVGDHPEGNKHESR
jgi:hypothetical protein